MRIGSRGIGVTKLQANLEFLGYNTGHHKFDGIFGPYTEEAVRRFQGNNGLKVDGWAGPKTIIALNEKVLRTEGLEFNNEQETKVADVRMYVLEEEMRDLKKKVEQLHSTFNVLIKPRK